MPKKIPTQNEKLIKFLSVDFRDTSDHLRDTDRKVEFTFQLYAGALSLLVSLLISFLAFSLGNQSIVNSMLSNTNPVLLFTLIILFLIELFSWWVFEYSLKGNQNHILHLNRMNFLRKEIYNYVGARVTDSPNFMYTKEIPPSERVGMVDMIPVALQWIMVILLFPFVAISYSLIKPIFVSGAILPIVIFIYVVLSTVIYLATRERRKTINKESKTKIEKSWKPQEQSKNLGNPQDDQFIPL